MPRIYKRTPVKERFEEKIEMIPECGCWIWTRNVLKGYGVIKIGDKQALAHRVSWELYKSPIPQGLCVLHRCDTPLCVNPHHLFLGTRAENSKDMVRKGRQGRGETGNSTLTEEMVIAIRSDARSYKIIAKEYNITPNYVYQIRLKMGWKHLP